MVEAERDRLEMSNKISRLEGDKRDLEAENAKTIEENRGLLNQLEELNSTISESDVHVKALEATLESTQQELRRLEGLAAKTHDLEIQLAALEQEQDSLQRTLVTTQDEERSAIQRWRKAERRLQDLQDQLERIEREAREERELHVEVLGRMERQRAVERELDTAAGRLKGAAAATTGNGKNGSNVVSHFVKDILQDNANLQMGIVELREMLVNANDEVQALREQLLMHQPLQDDNGDNSGPPTLRAELAPKQEPEPSVISQSLHIHHHYHVPKREETRRTKKKRVPINTSLFTPPMNFQGANPSIRSQETASGILSQTSVTVPSPITPSKRWSMQSAQMSDFAPSSVPSSPHSMYRNSTLFDRGFDIDSSRPTSPGSSVDPMSPQFQPHHRKHASEVSTRSFLAPTTFQPDNVIHEENDDVEDIQDLQTPSMPSLEEDTSPDDTSHESELAAGEEWQPTLRRSLSHESIISIGGLDIHTLKSRPSQLTLTGSGAMLRRPSRLGVPTSMTPVGSLTSSSMVTAKPTLSRQGYNSTMYIRSRIGAASTLDSRPIKSSNSGESPGLGKKVGWVLGRWGVSPAKSSNDLRKSSRTQGLQGRVVSTPTAVDPLQAFMGRPPGVNQRGPIPGLVKKEKAPSQVRPIAVDRDALREVFEDGLH